MDRLADRAEEIRRELAERPETTFIQIVIVSAILLFALQIIALNVRLAARELNRPGDAARGSPGASAPAPAHSETSRIRPSRHVESREATSGESERTTPSVAPHAARPQTIPGPQTATPAR
jgi:hypothetical protein